MNTNASDIAAELVGARILHVLGIYPKLSMSMLQVGIGTGFPPLVWHPVLDHLIAQGRIQKTSITMVNPVNNRGQTYTILQLCKMEHEQHEEHEEQEGEGEGVGVGVCTNESTNAN